MSRTSLGLAFAFLGAGVAGAESLPRLDPGVELQKQQQQQRLLWELKSSVPEVAIPQVPALEKPDEKPRPCVPVQEILLDGVTKFDVDEQRRFIKPYEGRCLRAADINALLQAINAAYVEKGYITSRAYLPEQQVASGRLRLQVLEGFIESLTLNGNMASSDRRRLAGAFPTDAGNILRLQDIEQGVDQLNRAPSAQAAVALAPGSQAGTSKVVVKTVDDRSWRVALNADNSGEDATGKYKFTAGLDKDNLFEFNDSWQLAFTRTLRSHAFS